MRIKFLRFPCALITLAIICLSANAVPIKVACVGDSITAGYALSDPGTQSYPAQLQVILGSGYTVGNYGNSGTTVEKVSDYTYWNSWAYNSATNSSPDIVVMMFGANDSKSWNWNAGNFNSDYRALITLFQNLPTHPKVYICYTPPMYLPNAFGTTFDPVFVENTVEPAIATVATQAGVQLIDNDTPLIDRADLFTDGVHPTASGAGIIAQQVANAINGIAPTNLTATAITSSANPSVYGWPVIYTATVTSSSGTPTGKVIFAASDLPYSTNQIPFSTNMLSGGVATVTNQFIPIGTNTVSAQYVFQGNYLGSTRSLYQTVSSPPATNTATTNILTSSSSPSIYGSPLTFTATIATTNGITAVSATSIVTFKDGANPIGAGSVSAGQASFTTNTLPAGAHSITAVYSGDTNYNPSTSVALSQFVNPLPVVITGSKVYDGTTNIAAANLTIANNLDGANLTLSGSGWLAAKDVGTQTIVTTNLTPTRVQTSWGNYNSWGLYPWFNNPPVNGNAMVVVVATRANYSNAVWGVSMGAANFTRIAQAVNTDGETIEIWYCPSVRTTSQVMGVSAINTLNMVCIAAEYTNLIAAGALDQIGTATNTGTAAVTGTTPVTTQAGELWLGGIGFANTNSFSSVLNGFTDVYSQSSSYPASNGTDQTTLHLLEKIVSSTGAAGSGGTIGASRPWAGAMATFKAASVPAGLTLGGSAAGNYTLVGAGGTATVTPASTGVALLSSTNPSTYSSNVTFTATVSSVAGTPTGQVIFLANGVAFSTNNLAAGIASASYNQLPVGTNTMTAQFGAQGNYQASSGSLQQAITIGAFDLSYSYDHSQLTLSWPAGGLLLEAPTLNGPWTTNVIGSNFCNISPTNAMAFFRILIP